MDERLPNFQNIGTLVEAREMGMKIQHIHDVWMGMVSMPNPKGSLNKWAPGKTLHTLLEPISFIGCPILACQQLTPSLAQIKIRNPRCLWDLEITLPTSSLKC